EVEKKAVTAVQPGAIVERDGKKVVFVLKDDRVSAVPVTTGGKVGDLVEIHNLAKSYTRGGQAVPVLSDITLDIAAGDFIALMGPSGSGKTTLLNLIAGIDKPDAGGLRVQGID